MKGGGGRQVGTDVGQLKRQAAEAAVAYVQSGMVLGLGYGSTALIAVRRIGNLLQAGRLHDIRGIPCRASWRQRRAGSGSCSPPCRSTPSLT